MKHDSLESPPMRAQEPRNELHLANHNQHRLTTARIIENGIKDEKNKFVYEVSRRMYQDIMIFCQNDGFSRKTSTEISESFSFQVP